MRRTIRAGRGSLRNEISQAVNSPGRDRLYEEALPIARNLAEQMEAR